MAEFERDLIRERVKAGLAHAKAQGVKLGRHTADRTRDRHAEIIRQMRDAGLSYARIGAELGRSPDTVHRIARALTTVG
jgi:DNA invertase Pin-like site-specific DNA recombinase